MPDFKHPDVYLSETLATPRATGGVSLSNGCFVAEHPRGPVGATLVSSFQEFTRLYGAFAVGQPADDLMYAVYQFFNNGGRQCYIVRVLSGTETAALVDLNDQEAGTPRVTLSVAASNPGAWGNALYVSITPSALDPNRFSLLVYQGGVAVANVVERFSDLSMDTSDPRHVVAVVNSPLRGSSYIRVTDAGLLATDPALTLADVTPAATTNPVVLTGGTAATGAPSATQWDAAFAAVDAVPDPLTLNVPGHTDSDTVNKALNYAAGRGDVFVVIDGVTGAGGTAPTAADAVAAATAYSATDLSYGAVYFPRPIIADPTSAVPGATRVVPPGGAVVGLFVASDAAAGVQKTPAGRSTRIANAVGLEVPLSNNDLDLLNQSNVNAIRSLPGAGVVVFGGRTLTTTGRADKYISVRRSLILVKAEIARIAQDHVFQPNDDLLREGLAAQIDQYLMGFWTSGGLVGASSAEAFYVVCDDSNNSPSDVANGGLIVDVGVAPQRPAEFISIRVSQFDGAVDVSENAPITGGSSSSSGGGGGLPV